MWVTLPAEGRQGEPPRWPLARPSAREKAVWAEEWKRPQAVMWEANGQQAEVALYVRSLIEAERPHASATLRGLVVRMQEALGLSLPGLARNKWTIGQPAARTQRRAATGTEGPSMRDRLRSIEGGQT